MEQGHSEFFHSRFSAFEAHHRFCINHCLRVYLERLSICYLLLQDKEMHTLTVALSHFFGQNQHQLQLVGAAALIAMLPMVTMFLLLQKYFIAGLSQGSVKG